MLSIILIALLSVGAVCAADIADDTVSAIDDVQTIESSDEIDEIIQESAIVEETQAAEEEPPIAADETKTFTQLITDIGDESSEVTLTGTYKFDSSVDTAYPVISRDLTINGPATIDGNGLTRLFAVNNSATLTLKNLNLINGYAGETMMDAGAILAQGGNLDIQGCTFKDNKAYRVGGAIRVAAGSSLKVTDSTFESCEAIGNQAGQGGAFTVGSAATGLEVRNCTFIDCNTTNFGGAIDTALANSIINNCTFISNRVGTYGGAVAVRGANTIVEDSVFKGNSAENGGGSAVVVYDVDATINNCIFDSNILPSDSEYGYQGAVYLSVNPVTPNDAMNVAISKCIFTNNSALKGSAIASYLSSFVVENSIFASNIATDEAYNLGPKATDIFLIDDSESPKTVVANNNWFGSTVNDYTALQTFNDTYNMWQGVANVKIDTWYFLDLKETAKENGYDILISLNNLYDNATGEVTQVTDYPLPDFKVTFSATAGKVSPVTATLENGVATAQYALTAIDGPGTITANLLGVKVSKKLGEKVKTVITVSPVKKYTYNKAVDAKKNYYIYATLKDFKGNLIKGKKIKIVSKGKTYTRTTDSKGRVKLLVTYVGKGTYSQKFTFLGDDKYLKVVKTIKLKVVAQKVKLSSKSRTFKATKKVKKLTATLKNSKGKAIKGKKIIFTVNGKKYTAKTNKKGVATVKVKVSKKKTYKVKVRFAGDKTYLKKTINRKLKIK